MTKQTISLAALLLAIGLTGCGDAADTGDMEGLGSEEATGVEQGEQADDLDTLEASSGGTVVNETIVVKSGQTYDGKGKRFTAGKSLGDGSQKEGQKPIFKLENGATLRNVVLGFPAADGVHTYGNANLSNIVWEDIGEDAMTIKKPGTVTLNGGSARKGDDKIFQINAESTFRVSNFKADGAGKFIRQNGGTTFKVQVTIDKCDIANMKESIFRTDSKTSTLRITNTRYHNIGKELYIVPNKSQVSASNVTKY